MKVKEQLDNLMTIAAAGFACDNCGIEITPNETRVAVCNDCGAIFCRDCVKDNVFFSHICAEEEFEM